MKFNETLMTLVEKNLEIGLIPMLLGEPGIGKSSWVIDLGNRMHTKVFVLACNQLADKADLTGARLVPITDGSGAVVDYEQVFYPHSVVNQAIKYAEEHPSETPILFMDELNRTTPDVTSEALSIPTLRSIGNKTLPSNLKVITAGNDKGNITSLDEASISRFVLYHVAPDVDTFLALDDQMNPFVKKVLIAHPETIFCKTITVAVGSDDDDEDGDVNIEEILDDGDCMNQIATPRTIMGLSKWLNTFSNQELIALIQETHTIDGQEVSTLQEAIEGCTGKTTFTTFLLAEITANIMSTNNQSNVIQVAKPAIYDAMKNCSDITALNDFIAGLSNNDKSGALVYALFEKVDNAKFINALAPEISKLEPNDMKMLMNLFSKDMLDEANKTVFLNNSSSISRTLEAIMC